MRKAAEADGRISYVFSENVANTDYERVRRQYAEQDKELAVGEAFAFERAAFDPAADCPETAFLMGSSFGSAQRTSPYSPTGLDRGVRSGEFSRRGSG